MTTYKWGVLVLTCLGLIASGCSSQPVVRGQNPGGYYPTQNQYSQPAYPHHASQMQASGGYGQSPAYGHPSYGQPQPSQRDYYPQGYYPQRHQSYVSQAQAIGPQTAGRPDQTIPIQNGVPHRANPAMPLQNTPSGFGRTGEFVGVPPGTPDIQNPYKLWQQQQAARQNGEGRYDAIETNYMQLQEGAEQDAVDALNQTDAYMQGVFTKIDEGTRLGFRGADTIVTYGVGGGVRAADYGLQTATNATEYAFQTAQRGANMASLGTEAIGNTASDSIDRVDSISRRGGITAYVIGKRAVKTGTQMARHAAKFVFGASGDAITGIGDAKRRGVKDHDIRQIRNNFNEIGKSVADLSLTIGRETNPSYMRRVDPDSGEKLGDWYPTHKYRWTYNPPRNLVYPQQNQPAAVVRYPYYTVKGPSDFFMKE